MKKSIIIVLILSVLLNAYLLLTKFDLVTGGGQHKQSPDEEYTVMINSHRNMNPLADSQTYYSVITLRKGFIAGDIIQKFVVSPINIRSEMQYRELKNPIQWSDDSRSVTITTSEYEIKAHIRPEQVGASNAN